MRVVIYGATGMVGTGVLIECLEDPRVESVLAMGRSSCGRTHPRLKEMIRSDLLHYEDVTGDLTGIDACFFCLGISSVGMDEESYHRVTHDLAVAAAAVLAGLNEQLTFCFVSGVGADSSERGKVMWARVKGKTENRLLSMPMRTYVFRPAYIQPLKGARSKTRLYQAFYDVLGPLYPLLKRLLPRQATTTENIGRAMIQVAEHGYEKRIIDNTDINLLAAR